ncbi:hypothetical protein OS242_10785 [Tumebacillus sp. DT12]|uniref:RCC1-like domain-containing protein n=1 Tax=Tumebacillus lacus TaxID=2995335 RepID=A0ABT3X3A2_9BACL|nr:hypothetical protein [Tumebacillus lacus]MCX7570447.1 hypothetical protein [Tumebacillus lacus]
MRPIQKVMIGTLMTTMAWGAWSMSAAYAEETHIYAGGQLTFVTMGTKAFGSGDGGALGYSYSTTGYAYVPTELKLSDDVRKISRSGLLTLVLKTDGTVWAMGKQGKDDAYNGSELLKNVAYSDWKPVYGLTGVVDIAAGSDHALALKADGTVWAWGQNDVEQVGLPVDTLTTAIPTRVEGVTGVKSISAGDRYSLALKTDGTVWGWGMNSGGQLGVGTQTDSSRTPVQVHNLTNVAAVDAGDRHALAVLADGTVWGWGDTWTGAVKEYDPEQGPFILEPEPISLQGVTEVSAGNEFSMALKQDGTVWAWGSDQYGVLGQGMGTTNTFYNPSPVQVLSLSQITEIAAGDNSALAKTADNSIYSWGDIYGGLGIGYVEGVNDSTPKRMKNPLMLSAEWEKTGPSEITLNYRLQDAVDPTLQPAARYVVVRSGDGGPTCDGAETTCNFSNLPGNESVFEITAYDANNNWVAQKRLWVPSVSLAKRSDGDYHSMWLKEDGTLHAFGLNSNGQLGDGTRTNRLYPVQVMSGVTNTAAGYRSTLASKSDGTLWAFGANNYGQLGYGNTTEQLKPVQVKNVLNVTAFDLEDHHGAAVTADGSVWTWGSNSNGQLATGDKTNRLAPIKVTTLTGVKDVKTGSGHTLFLKNDGTVWSVGRNDFGQLGNRTAVDSAVPVQVAHLANIVAISAGPLHSAALTRDGDIYTWGYNVSGQLGNGNLLNSSVPVKTSAWKFHLSMDAGRGHMISTASDGSVWTWGYNFKGQLGNGSRTDTATPVELTGQTAVKVSAGGEHSGVIQADGKAFAFGSNSYGEAGDGTRTYSTTAVQVGSPYALSLYVTSPSSTTMSISTSATGVAKRMIFRNDLKICEGICSGHTDSGLTAFTPYTYRVDAFDANNQLVASKQVVEATKAATASSGLEGFEQEYFEEDFYPLQ